MEGKTSLDSGSAFPSLLSSHTGGARQREPGTTTSTGRQMEKGSQRAVSMVERLGGPWLKIALPLAEVHAGGVGSGVRAEFSHGRATHS